MTAFSKVKRVIDNDESVQKNGTESWGTISKVQVELAREGFRYYKIMDGGRNLLAEPILGGSRP